MMKSLSYCLKHLITPNGPCTFERAFLIHMRNRQVSCAIVDAVNVNAGDHESVIYGCISYSLETRNLHQVPIEVGDSQIQCSA